MTDDREIPAAEALLMGREEESCVDRAEWDRSCGEHLLNYAESVNQANGKAPRASDEFRLAENLTLHLLPDLQGSHTASIAVEDENGNPVYSSVVESRQAGNRWTTSCNELTSDADRKLIASLPQRSQDYQKQQAAQALITQLVSKYPDAFTQREESSARAIMIAAGNSSAYRFQVAEINGQTTILGAEPQSDRLAFKASYVDQAWRVEHCSIPSDRMKEMLRAYNDEGSQKHSTEKHRSKLEESGHSRNQRRLDRELD